WYLSKLFKWIISCHKLSMYKVYNSDTFKEVFYPLNININEVLASNISDKTIGNKIRKLRVSLGLTQLQFAKSINR
ncbi:hypothetical protein, partial [uncultured Clostridium sp.]|uniref:hypothetical protein n=2 Tax=uncultured Clostridium sp. TaxID=59620 RepID=UPI002729E829